MLPITAQRFQKVLLAFCICGLLMCGYVYAHTEIPGTGISGGAASEFDAVGREIIRRDAQSGEIILQHEYWDDGTLRYSKYKGDENWFDKNGTLIRTVQKEGDIVTYAADGSLSIERPGEKKIFYYDADGREIRVTDIDGTVIRETEYLQGMRVTVAQNGVTERVYTDEDGFEYRVEITPVFGFTIVADITKNDGGTIALINEDGEERFSARVRIDENGEVQFDGGGFIVRAILWFADLFGYDIEI